MPRRPTTAIGIDLAASPARDTGICILAGRLASVSVARSDEDILSAVRAVAGKKAVGIDAPLSLPPGRRSIDEKNASHFRPCDLELRRRGIRFFPITIGPMRMLTKRGMALMRRLRKMPGVTSVHEVYPGATFDVFKVPRKGSRHILRWAGGFANLQRRAYTQDELDSVAAAITVSMHLSGETEALGPRGGHCIIIPAYPPSNRNRLGETIINADTQS